MIARRIGWRHRYVSVTGLSNVAVFLLFVSLWMIPFADSARALDRDALVGTGVGMPLRLDPSTEKGDLTYSVDLGYFINEVWGWVLTWDFGLQEEERVDLAVGVMASLEMDWPIRPYMTAKFLYLLSPDQDLGWRLSAGLEWSLRPLTKIDNIGFFVETGVSQLFRSGYDELSLEMFKTGLSWSY